MTPLQRLAIVVLALVLLIGNGAAEDTEDAGPTPPRLSLIEGEVSFSRPGDETWTTALLNTPLAAGDALYAGDQARFEVQFGRRAFVRGAPGTQLELLQLEDRQLRRFLRFRLAAGQAVFDLHELPAGLAIEVETPNAQMAIERGGYYRLNVDQDTTFLGIRRDGRASVVPAGGAETPLEAGEELVIEGSDAPNLSVYPLGDSDAWDRWNDERAARFAAADSAPDLPPDIYGAEALNGHGRWQPEAEYGAVWIPSGMASDWSPYSSGRWVSDPYYGWTWIDHAPWGWAPFHYGRWVFVRGFWAWAPGPRVLRSVYAPALVGFVSFRQAPHGHKTRPLGWVALSWGEPLHPWWGHRGFVGRPWWGGWHGPRRGDGFDGRAKGHHFRNAEVGNALVAVPPERFGRGPVDRAPVGVVSPGDLTPVAGNLPVPVTPHRWSVGRVGAIPPRTASGALGRGPDNKADFNRVFRPATPPIAGSPSAVAVQAPTVLQPAALGPSRDHQRGDYRDRAYPGPAGAVGGTITPRRFAVRPMSPSAGAAIAPIQPIAPVAPFVAPPRAPFVVPPTSSSVPLPAAPRTDGWRDDSRRDRGRGGDWRDDKPRGQGSSGSAEPTPAKRRGNASGIGGAADNSSGFGRSWRESGAGRR